MCVVWATHGLPSFDGAGLPCVLTGTDQRDAPSRQDDGDIRGPTLCGWWLCCRGREWSRWRRYPPTHTLGRERVSRCSVDSRGSCIRVLVVVSTNSSASVASPRILLHLLLHALRFLDNRLHIVLRASTFSVVIRCLNSRNQSFLSPQANFTKLRRDVQPLPQLRRVVPLDHRECLPLQLRPELVGLLGVSLLVGHCAVTLSTSCASIPVLCASSYISMFA